jgi:hypothetical protein
MTLGSVTSCAVSAEQGRWKMTDKSKKTTPRRSVSKPRLLKATYSLMDEYELNKDDPISDLITSIEKAIVADSMK